MQVQLTILGSGSAGNCALIESTQMCVLVDAGLSGKQISDRLAKIGRQLSDLDAILLTHEHNDHTQGLNVLCNRHHIPLYCNRPTAEEIAKTLPKFSAWHFFITGHPFELGDLMVESFSIPHDAQDPVGFLIRANGSAICFATDLGHATRLVIERARAANIVVLETNHDLRMLQEAKRPWSLKQRIMSRHGHLSNDDGATAAAEIATDKLRALYLAHLSRDCNRPSIALEAVTGQLERAGAKHITVQVAQQDEIMPTLTL